MTPGLVSHYFSSAEQLITAAFRGRRGWPIWLRRDRVSTPRRVPVDKMDALMDYVLDDSSDDDECALARSVESRPPQCLRWLSKPGKLTDEWLACIADIVRAGVAYGAFKVADVEVAARRVLTMIDGLGAQKVRPGRADGRGEAHRARVLRV